MTQKSRAVVIFDESGKEIMEWSPTLPMPDKNKFEKDPGATELVEVLVVKDGKLKSEWHKMFTTKQFVVALIALALVAALLGVIGYYDTKRSWERYQMLQSNRIFCDCETKTPGLSPDNKEDKDKGCRPQCLIPE